MVELFLSTPGETEDDQHPRDLLERTEELHRIDRALDRLAGGRGGLLVVEGDAGSGRTRLLNELVTRARGRGMPTHTASGSADEQNAVFGICDQLFGPNCGPKEPPPQVTRASPLGTGLLVDIGTLIGSAPFGVSPVPRLVVPASPWDGVFAAVNRRVTELCGSGPIVIAVDDVSSLDSVSLRWLGYLARRLPGLPVLLAVAVSTDTGTSPDLLPLTAELRNRLDAVTLRSAPLSRRAVAQLLDRHTGQPVPDSLVAVCAELTGGNAFLVGELVRTLAQQNIDPSLMPADRLAKIAPSGVAHHVIGRVTRLPPATKQVVHALAVLASSTSAEDLAQVCDLEEPVVRDALLALNQLGIVRSVPPVQLAHPLVGNALYANMPSDERRRYHLAAARLFHLQRDAAPQVAWHLLATPFTAGPQTVEMLCEVAVDLIASGERTLAADCLRRVVHGSIATPHRGSLALTIGELLVSEDPRGAITWLRYAVSVLTEPDKLGRAQLTLGRVLAVCGQVPQAVEVLRKCAGGLAETRPELAELVHEAQVLLSLLHGDTVGAARTRLAHPVGVSRRDTLPVPRAVHAAWSGADRDGAVRHTRPVLEESLVTPARPLETMAAVLTLVHADRGDLAARYLDGISDKTPHLAEVHAVRAAIALANGEVDQAVRSARQAAELVTAGAPRPLLLDHRAVLAAALSELDEPSQAAEVLADTGAGWSLSADWHVNHLLETRGRLRLAADEVHAGLADLLECGRRLRRWEVDNPLVNGWRSDAAIALSRVGDQERAVALAEDQLAAAHRWGAPRAVGLALRARGLVEKDPQARARWLDQGVERLRESPARLDLARTMLDLGESMISLRVVQRAREQLREGLAVAQRCGATALAARAHDQLLRSGARPRRRAQFGREALTDSELRTALMAAQGHTNREIAKQMFVTQRTIELHLTNAYRKLHIRNRADLGAALDAEA